MTAKEINKRICPGYGKYEGKCGRPAGTPWTPFWCPRCDELRRKRIRKQLENISDELKAEGENDD